jgi:lysylphosphatidylglycerol synthetase-like protein (DUF2156 family)
MTCLGRSHPSSSYRWLLSVIRVLACVTWDATFVFPFSQTSHRFVNFQLNIPEASHDRCNCNVVISGSVLLLLSIRLAICKAQKI